MNTQNQDGMDLELEREMESQDEAGEEPYDDGAYDDEDDSLETTSLTIKGHLLKWGNYVVQISNISLVSSGEKEPPRFPIGILWAALAGIVMLAFGISQSSGRYGGSEISGGMIGLGILVLVAALVALVKWLGEVWSAQEEKYLHIHMNSGKTYSILFKDKEFLEKKVIPVFSQIFENGAKGNMSFYIDIRNCNIEDSSIGNTVKGK